MDLATAREMREMDECTIESFGILGRVLMENAGRGVVRVILEAFPQIRKVGIAAGKGNNGGDGFVVARYLAHRGIGVTVFLLADPAGLKGDAKANFDLLKDSGAKIRVVPNADEIRARASILAHQQLWVDAIFGTGLASDVRGHYKDFIDFINNSGRPVVAVDIASGIHSDTGLALGSAVRADITVTFGLAKIGHVMGPGLGRTGKLRIIDIGIPPHMVRQVDPKTALVTHDFIRSLFKPRRPDAHKGDGGASSGSGRVHGQIRGRGHGRPFGHAGRGRAGHPGGSFVHQSPVGAHGHRGHDRTFAGHGFRLPG